MRGSDPPPTFKSVPHLCQEVQVMCATHLWTNFRRCCGHHCRVGSGWETARRSFFAMIRTSTYTWQIFDRKRKAALLCARTRRRTSGDESRATPQLCRVVHAAGDAPDGFVAVQDDHRAPSTFRPARGSVAAITTVEGGQTNAFLRR